jgi:hypothetical protein
VLVEDACRPVAPDDAVLEAEVGALLDGVAELPVDAPSVVGVDVAQEAVVARREPARFEPVDAVELVRPGDLVGGNVPFPAPDVRRPLRLAEQRRETLASLPEE